MGWTVPPCQSLHISQHLTPHAQGKPQAQDNVCWWRASRLHGQEGTMAIEAGGAPQCDCWERRDTLRSYSCFQKNHKYTITAASRGGECVLDWLRSDLRAGQALLRLRPPPCSPPPWTSPKTGSSPRSGAWHGSDEVQSPTRVNSCSCPHLAHQGKAKHDPRGPSHPKHWSEEGRAHLWTPYTKPVFHTEEQFKKNP